MPLRYVLHYYEKVLHIVCNVFNTFAGSHRGSELQLLAVTEGGANKKPLALLFCSALTSVTFIQLFIKVIHIHIAECDATTSDNTGILHIKNKEGTHHVAQQCHAKGAVKFIWAKESN